jgi:hypothetical protein
MPIPKDERNPKHLRWLLAQLLGRCRWICLSSVRSARRLWPEAKLMRTHGSTTWHGHLINAVIAMFVGYLVCHAAESNAHSMQFIIGRRK